MKQTTIENRVESVGIGLHKGEPIKIVLEPLEADEGIVFHRSDLGISIKATPENVVNTQMATVIGKDGAMISTIEHLLSAIYSYGIDNIRIAVDGAEVPVMDGSSASFCMLLDEAKKRVLNAPKKFILIKKPVEIQEREKFVRVIPSTTPTFRFKIDFDHVAIGSQEYSFEFSKKNFLKEISKARTFGFLKDVQMLRSRGLALGGSLDNAVVMDEKKILNPEGLRFENEFVKHKILDALGDLALLGAPVIGDYESFAGSHHLNHLLTKEILKDSSNYEVKTFEFENMYEKVFA
ncbi:MAG: UDP-3-O-acyl-N-acetylglucosamine deacetylase [Sulfurospirillaceae bacterium]|nr:UDP-3-O-acyl-N-acetylglucosamine deacetylase [Sulfurospirillaceae bacterium]MCK9545494.1 UDP-3-O-acyl-N-acetylglucosamine deacetylase [Sulfurospirillaceae bacterium]NLM99250.1 UDP-3-O-acyl-N-acetylglucosamine deacetylase [Campylobacteraceae bacterium]